MHDEVTGRERVKGRGKAFSEVRQSSCLARARGLTFDKIRVLDGSALRTLPRMGSGALPASLTFTPVRVGSRGAPLRRN